MGEKKRKKDEEKTVERRIREIIEPLVESGEIYLRTQKQCTGGAFGDDGGRCLLSAVVPYDFFFKETAAERLGVDIHAAANLEMGFEGWPPACGWVRDDPGMRKIGERLRRDFCEWRGEEK